VTAGTTPTDRRDRGVPVPRDADLAPWRGLPATNRKGPLQDVQRSSCSTGRSWSARRLLRLAVGLAPGRHRTRIRTCLIVERIRDGVSTNPIVVGRAYSQGIELPPARADIELTGPSGPGSWPSKLGPPVAPSGTRWPVSQTDAAPHLAACRPACRSCASLYPKRRPEALQEVVRSCPGTSPATRGARALATCPHNGLIDHPPSD
jgi:hypothetical protein